MSFAVQTDSRWRPQPEVRTYPATRNWKHTMAPLWVMPSPRNLHTAVTVF